MKLHALNWSFPMTKSHDDSVGCGAGDHKGLGNRCRIDHEGVVSGHREHGWEPLEDALAVMSDHRRPSVHHGFGADNVRPEELSDQLMTKAYSEHRSHFQLTEDGDPALRRGGSSWPWRNDDAIGVSNQMRCPSDNILPDDPRIRAERPYILGEVVDKGVVVVDDEDVTEHLYHRS